MMLALGIETIAFEPLPAPGRLLRAASRAPSPLIKGALRRPEI